MAPWLARADALIFGDIEGQHRNPEHVSRQFLRDVVRCRKELTLTEDDLPDIRLHDLRHTHATLFCWPASRCTSSPSASATPRRS